MWFKIKKITDHKKYDTIPDYIFYGNNIFSKYERQKRHSIHYLVK